MSAINFSDKYYGTLRKYKDIRSLWRVTSFDTICMAIAISNKWTWIQKNIFRIYTRAYETTQPSQI